MEKNDSSLPVCQRRSGTAKRYARKAKVIKPKFHLLAGRTAKADDFAVDAQVARQGHFATQCQGCTFNRNGLAIAARCEIDRDSFAANDDLFVQRRAQTVHSDLGLRGRQINGLVKTSKANCPIGDQRKPRRTQ